MKISHILTCLLLALLAFQTDSLAKGKNDEDQKKKGTEEETVENGKGGKKAGAEEPGGKKAQNANNPDRKKQAIPERPKQKNDEPVKRPKSQDNDNRGGDRAKGENNRARDNDNRAKDDDNRAKDNDNRAKDNDNRAKDNDNRAKDNDNRAKDNDNRAKDNDSRAKDNDNRAKDNDNRAKDNDNRAKDNDSRAKDNDSRAKDNDSRAKDNDNRVKVDNGDKVKVDDRDKVKIDDRDTKIDKDTKVKVDNGRTKNVEKNVTNINIDRRPGKTARPARQERHREWAEVHEKNVRHWETWRETKVVHVEKFRVERRDRWRQVVVHEHDRDWPRHFHDNDYRAWRRNVWDFRRDRAEEIWVRRRDRWDDCFDDHWWGYAAWRPRPRVYVNVSPWWWWRPVTWTNVSVFFGGSVAAQPVVYDPGTSVVYQDDNYYVDGELRGPAREARHRAVALANPRVEETPVPEPAENGEAETWQPLGVWALTQQEQGDANMFVQLSVNRDGLVAGAYKNVMTGDEQPIVGQLDKEKQVLAWHVGDASETVYETGLSNLENDVASVFVHFGEDDTQTWLLVRLPSPEMPPSTVKIPDYVAQN